MTIDERVKQTLAHANSAEFAVYLKAAFKEVARDQRWASGNALVEAYGRQKGGKILGETAYQAVINATIE